MWCGAFAFSNRIEFLISVEAPTLLFPHKTVIENVGYGLEVQGQKPEERNKTAMEKIIKDEGYEVVEMNQFMPGANYAIFKKPGKQNPVVYKIDDITID